MFIIGERLNTSIKEISEAVKSRDKARIVKEARDQVSAGAGALDINAGTHGKSEMNDALWMLEIVQDKIDIPLSLDSSNPEVLVTCLEKYKNPKTPIINSITGEDRRLSPITGLLEKYECDVIALAMDDKGIPDSPSERVEIITRIINHLDGAGIDKSRVYADPLVFPISTDTTKALCTIETLRGIKETHPDLRTIVGLSNISYGLPKPRLLNKTFLAILMASGLDAAILDPTMPGIMSTVWASKVLLNQDEYCGEYIGKHREGKLER